MASRASLFGAVAALSADFPGALTGAFPTADPVDLGGAVFAALADDLGDAFLPPAALSPAVEAPDFLVTIANSSLIIFEYSYQNTSEKCQICFSGLRRATDAFNRVGLSFNNHRHRRAELLGCSRVRDIAPDDAARRKGVP